MVGLSSWIAKYWLIKQLRTLAIKIFSLIKTIRKKLFGVSKEQLHNKSLAHLHWSVVNEVMVIEL
jgi:hypothetical protein